MEINGKRIFTTISLFSILALLPMSCGLFCNDSCGCGPSPGPQEIRVQSFATQTVNKSNQEINKTESGPYAETFVTLRIDEIENKAQGLARPSESGSIGLAYACSPLPPMSENLLYLIQIINEKEFTTSDGTHYQIGENITSLFGMSHFYAPGLSRISDFTRPGKRLTFEDFYKIGLLEDPQQELNLKFTIRLRFDDAQEFLLTDQTLNVR